MHIKHILKALEKIPPANRQDFRNKLDSSVSFKNKVGKLVLEQLNKADSDKKSELIGMLFCGVVSSDCEVEDFGHYAQLINAMYAKDITYLLSAGQEGIDETGDEVEHLISIGCYMRDYGGFGDSALPKKQPKLSEAGTYIFGVLNLKPASR
jgi:hypothetical protein